MNQAEIERRERNKWIVAGIGIAILTCCVAGGAIAYTPSTMAFFRELGIGGVQCPDIKAIVDLSGMVTFRAQMPIGDTIDPAEFYKCVRALPDSAGILNWIGGFDLDKSTLSIREAVDKGEEFRQFAQVFVSNFNTLRVVNNTDGADYSIVSSRVGIDQLNAPDWLVFLANIPNELKLVLGGGGTLAAVAIALMLGRPRTKSPSINIRASGLKNS